jgi:hypothetical protein
LTALDTPILLGYYNIVFVTLVLFICEVSYTIFQSREIKFKDIEDTMTGEEFDKKIKEGSQFVILDDLILDVGMFQYYHPGGTFVIS